MKPIITDNTIMIDKHCQNIIMCCKRGNNHLESLRQCVADITGLELKHVGYHAIYHWIAETYKQLSMNYLFKNVLDRVFSYSGIDLMLYKDLNHEEKILNIMCSELCLLQINEKDKQGNLVALIDMREVTACMN
jgi:hypothetical protein